MSTNFGILSSIAISSVITFSGCAKIEESLRCKTFDQLEITHQKAILAITRTPPQSICRAQGGSLLIIIDPVTVIQNRQIPFDPKEGGRKKDDDSVYIMPIF